MLHYNEGAMNVGALCAGWVGRTIGGRFTLQECLGSSESSAVFLTELKAAEPRKAVVKLIPADGVEADQRLGSWAIAAALSHPHFLRVFHTGQWQLDGVRCVYVVSEYAEEVLSQILPARALTADETREMLIPVIDALSWLHASGFVHGRLRPSNIMVVGDQLKLTSDSLLAAGSVRTSLQPASIYDAPENGISPATDIWSLGATIVETLTQHPPVWDRSTDAEPVIPDSIPQPFSTIARSCLRPIPTYRCSLSDISSQLEAKIETPPPPVPPPTPHIHPMKKAPAFKLPVMPMVVVLAVLLGIFVILQLHRHGSTAPADQPQQAQTATADRADQDHSAPSAPGMPSGPVTPGAVSKKVMPAVSHAAQATIRGTVQLTVRIAVNAAGKVTDASLALPGPSKYFARLAQEASRSWEFTPAKSGGQPVASSWLLHYELTISSIEATAKEETP